MLSRTGDLRASLLLLGAVTLLAVAGLATDGNGPKIARVVAGGVVAGGLLPGGFHWLALIQWRRLHSLATR